MIGPSTHIEMVLDTRYLETIIRPGEGMNKKRELAPVVIPPKPPKHEISDAEFRRRLKQKTSEWRKERLAELRSKNSH